MIAQCALIIGDIMQAGEISYGEPYEDDQLISDWVGSTFGSPFGVTGAPMYLVRYRTPEEQKAYAQTLWWKIPYTFDHDLSKKVDNILIFWHKLAELSEPKPILFNQPRNEKDFFAKIDAAKSHQQFNAYMLELRKDLLEVIQSSALPEKQKLQFIRAVNNLNDDPSMESIANKILSAIIIDCVLSYALLFAGVTVTSALAVGTGASVVFLALMSNADFVLNKIPKDAKSFVNWMEKLSSHVDAYSNETKITARNRLL